jgi:hypothetical protein
MAATEQIFKQLLQLCSTDYYGEGLYNRGGFAELCFPNYDDDDEDGGGSSGPAVFSWIPRVQIVDEPNLKFTSKFILDASQMHQIARFVLPKELAFRRWKRLYSLARDGDCFEECLDRIQGQARTLLVVRTCHGEAFGGYADTAWERDNHEFHGSEQSKVFSFVPLEKLTRESKAIESLSSSEDSSEIIDAIVDAPDERDDAEARQLKKKRQQDQQQQQPLRVYKWSGLNRDFQYCDPSRTLIAFGSGGARFGLSIERDFRFGSTGQCDTYENDPLCSEGNFRILDMEIWGFVAMEDACCSCLCFQPEHVPEEHIDWIPPVRVVREPYRTEKFILDAPRMNQIARYVLPQGIAACRWKRVYSLARDGDSFESCLHLIRKEQRSLMVIRTADDRVFGAYADSPWRAAHCNYYGSAQARLWTFVPDTMANEAHLQHQSHYQHQPHHDSATIATNLPEPSNKVQLDSSANTSPTDAPLDTMQQKIKVYKWTGINRYIQYCDITHRILAFGGGGESGSFGLCVEKDFQTGSTGPCATFGNEPLCDQEHFKIVDLEIWGFLTGQF